MAVGSILAFWGVAAVLIAVPGADWAFVVGVALRRRSVGPAVLGLVVGYAGITAVVAAGVGAAVAGSPGVLTGLTVVGGGYLAWHGVRTLVRPAVPVERDEAGTDASAAAAGGSRAILLQGIGVSGLNPKGLLIFMALLPQFTRPGQPLPVAGQIGVLGLAFVVTVAAFYLLLGMFAQTVLHARPGAARAVGRIAGASMAVIGVLLVVERMR